MNYKIAEKVILRRVLAFYLTTILETGTGVKQRFTESLMIYYSTGGRNCFEENWFYASEGNRCSTVLKRTGAPLFSGEGN